MFRHNKIFKIKCKLKNIRRKVKVFDEVESTNSLLLDDKKCKSGSVVWAKVQTKGKGRLNRLWISKPGGLRFSVCFIIKNNISSSRDNESVPTKMQTLTSGINLSSALSVVKALENLGIQGAGIKWPNDVYLSEHKVCGILTQTVFAKDKIKIVLGIGLNVNQNAEDFPEGLQNKASSLKIITTRIFKLEEVLTQILKQLDTYISQIIADHSLTRIISELNSKSILTGKSIKIQQGENIIIGEVLGISDDGGIIIQNSKAHEQVNKNIVTLYAGEIMEIW